MDFEKHFREKICTESIDRSIHLKFINAFTTASLVIWVTDIYIIINKFNLCNFEWLTTIINEHY